MVIFLFFAAMRKDIFTVSSCTYVCTNHFYLTSWSINLTFRIKGSISLNFGTCSQLSRVNSVHIEVSRIRLTEHKQYIGIISSRTMALGSTQPLTKMNTRNLPGAKGWAARKADLTAICGPIVYKMWEPRRLTTLWASTACYRDSFTFFYVMCYCLK
jgi:hypothetical protein